MIYTREAIRTLLRQQLADTPGREAGLFGSYAKGNPREESDLDLVIDMDGQTGNFAFWGVYEKLREAFAIPVELFERSEIVPGMQADREIRETGVVVYER